ncbi:endonuclease/exonuclease/phosphatase family protein [Streptomyces sp. LZ34]
MSVSELAEDVTEAQPPHPRWGLGTRSVVIGTGLWIAFLAAHLLLAGRWWVWLIVETMPPITLVVVPLALLACAQFARPVRRWASAALVTALLAGAPFAGLAPTATFGDSGSGPRTGTLKVFSWNTDYWRMTDDATAFYAYLRAQHADVYLLQEYLYWDDGPVRINDLARLRAAFPGYRIAAASELVTISRIPLVAQRLLPAPDTDWRGSRVLRTDVRYGTTVMSLYNVHLAVPVNLELSPLTKKFYRYTHDEYRRRQAELTALRADLARNPLPRLVAGDFNSAWGQLLTLPGGVERRDPGGFLFPRSWPAFGISLPRLWRLDWVFSTADVKVRSYRFISPRAMSDHMAQVLQISVVDQRDDR